MLDGGNIFLRFQFNAVEIITEVEDTGPGIAPEVAGKIFQPFATHGKAHGAGLGLSIAKKSSRTTAGKFPRAAKPGAARSFPSRCRWRNEAAA